MTEFLLPILVFSVPVLGIVLLAMAGRRLTKSCGGTGPDGRCLRCGESGNSLALAGDGSAGASPDDLACTKQPFPKQPFAKQPCISHPSHRGNPQPR